MTEIIDIVPRIKRTAGAARVLLALSFSDVARARSKLLLLPLSAAGLQREVLLRELSRAETHLQTYIPILKDLPSNAPWPAGAASLLYRVPGATYPTPSALWPHRILAAASALREHATAMEGELLRQLAAAVAELPDLVSETIVDVVTPEPSWTPWFIAGGVILGAGAVWYLGRR